MEVDITLSNKCIFQNILDTVTATRNMEQKSFLQLTKVLFNNAVKVEKMYSIVEFIIILINGSIILVALLQCINIKTKASSLTEKAQKRWRKF